MEYPQYTRPEDFKNMKVPEILLSGNHKDIKNWRELQSLKKTLKKNNLSNKTIDKENKLIKKIISDYLKKDMPNTYELNLDKERGVDKIITFLINIGLFILNLFLLDKSINFYFEGKS